MDHFEIHGGKPLTGTVQLAGAKNVALKAMVTALLTDEPVTLENMPHIDDVSCMRNVLASLGVEAGVTKSRMVVHHKEIKPVYRVPLELGSKLRTSSMVVGPLLARFGNAIIPNPGGCRLGARPINWHMQGLEHMGASVRYDTNDGFFHCSAPDGLHGTTYTFAKNTHTGTETLLLAAVCAKGTTILHNAAQEVEVDDLVALLNAMGAQIQRTAPRTLTVKGVRVLHGASYSIMYDRNEEVTFAIASALTKGEITVRGSQPHTLTAFYQAFRKAGGNIRHNGSATVYSISGIIQPVDIVTSPYPGFMTDWQAPWAVFMTQAQGQSTIHETVFEHRFSYVSQLTKMGASIDFYSPQVTDSQKIYNFDYEVHAADQPQAIRINGPTKLHSAVMTMSDLRAGATLVLASLAADGMSIVGGVEHIDRGYEKIEQRFMRLGASIVRRKGIIV